MNTEGQTLSTVFACTDPTVRFTMPDGSVRTARSLSDGPIPDDDGAAIYAAFEDEEGFVYVGIAPSSENEDIGAWISEQMHRPLFKSLDRVDLLGNVIGGQP